MCLLTWLQLAITAYDKAQQPTTNYIVRPLQKGTQTFAEKGMIFSAIWGRLTAHLKIHGHVQWQKCAQHKVWQDDQITYKSSQTACALAKCQN